MQAEGCEWNGAGVPIRGDSTSACLELGGNRAHSWSWRRYECLGYRGGNQEIGDCRGGSSLDSTEPSRPGHIIWEKVSLKMRKATEEFKRKYTYLDLYCNKQTNKKPKNKTKQNKRFA